MSHDQKYVIPGNVYQVLQNKNDFVIPNLPEGSINIVIDMTPPCDFAVDKKVGRAKLLAGFYIEDMSKNQLDKYSKDSFYKELDGLYMDGLKKPQKFRFNFRFSGSIDEKELQDTTKYKLLFKVKDKLFADILQKMSSYSSRLGVPMLKG